MYSALEDRRIKCTSVMMTLKVGRYLEIVEKVYKQRGGLEGQRAPLKTKTALTIRSRMVADLQAGAIIPPVVVGVLCDEAQLQAFQKVNDAQTFEHWFAEIDSDAISIIDGMQRTTALNEARLANEGVSETTVRVEFWISRFINSLIYRMLVLNTGQVPWELGRQLETVYSQFTKRISSELGNSISIFSRDEKRRRSEPGQYQSSNIIELLLIFSSRKSEIDIKDRVAEDFARLDTIETTAHAEFIDLFVETLHLMANLDKAFSLLPKSEGAEAGRLRAGRDIFASFPAMAGFAAAVSIYLFDEPGFRIDWAQVPVKMKQVTEAVGVVVNKLENSNEEQRAEFMQLDTLVQRLSGRRGGVGRYEREVFRHAFSAMLRNAKRLETMEPCWLAP